MVKYKTMDANQAVANVAYKFSEICGIYPITPASPMAEHIDELASHGEVNYFGNEVKIIEMQSEISEMPTPARCLVPRVLLKSMFSESGR